MSELINEILATAILVALMLFNAPAIPKFYHELLFYYRCGWDFSRESETRVILQDQLSEKYSFLPIGAHKLIILLTQISFFCAPLLIEWHAYMSRA